MQKPYIQLHAHVVVFAFTAILGHLISLPAIALVCWRTGIAAVLFFTILRPRSLPGNKPFRMKSALTGILLGAHWMTFFGAIKLANVTVCLTGIATISLFTAITEAIQERRRPKLNEILLGLIIIPSIVLIVGVSDGQLMGLFCAILSALLASTFTVINKSLIRSGIPSAAITQYEMLGGFLTCLVAGLLFKIPLNDWLPASSDWIWIVTLATVCTVFAYQWHLRLLQQFSAFEMSLAINLEPVYGILMAAVLFAEHKQMHPLFFVGALMILAVNFIAPLVRLIRKRKVPTAIKL